MGIKKLLSGLTLRRAFKKGIKEGVPFYRFWFFLIVAFKVMKWIFAKADARKEQEYELSPGEYRVIVNENKKS